MICLGIESTAHTFGVGLINDKGKILLNEKRMFIPQEGGIHPREAAEHHAKIFDELLKKVDLGSVKLIAYSQGPGLPPCLKVGAVVARTLALKLKKPLVGVNHCVAHLEIGKLVTKAKSPVLLYVSGANTQVIAFESGRYRLFGETLDIGVGNMLDVFGRAANLQFPAGPKIERLAEKGKKYVRLPYTVKGMDLSFAGILTNAVSKLKTEKLEDVCYSLQETVFAMLVEVAERAMAHTQKDELILGGGVGANKRLNEMCCVMCKDRGAKFFEVPKELCVDNPVMIAWNGILKYKSNGPDKFEPINKDYRTDQVMVTWL